MKGRKILHRVYRKRWKILHRGCMVLSPSPQKTDPRGAFVSLPLLTRQIIMVSPKFGLNKLEVKFWKEVTKQWLIIRRWDGGIYSQHFLVRQYRSLFTCLPLSKLLNLPFPGQLSKSCGHSVYWPLKKWRLWCMEKEMNERLNAYYMTLSGSSVGQRFSEIMWVKVPQDIFKILSAPEKYIIL